MCPLPPQSLLEFFRARASLMEVVGMTQVKHKKANFTLFSPGKVKEDT
jgi:hypothetical protein